MIILDLGCGKGTKIDVDWIKLSGCTIVGVDNDLSKLKMACENGINCIYYDLDTGKLPFKDNCFDGVVAQDILEHLITHIKIRDEVYRVLKDGGWFYVKVPSAYSPNVWRDYTHKRGYTEDSIKNFIQDGGFTIKRVDRYKRVALLTKNPKFAIKSLLLILFSKILGYDFTTYSYYVLCSKERK